MKTQLTQAVSAFSDQLHLAAQAAETMVPEVTAALRALQKGHRMTHAEIDHLRIAARSILVHVIVISRAGDALDTLAAAVLKTATA